ncbi:peptidase [Microcoleus sp. FACHB-SPT15]|uniref:peptidase n=1 Tax=Microcoleus sp. FACHB-SPT15 TaxID=2692830 RepID=UPI0028C46FA5|nr:peptidase [Microcoleus sp. FACHB-SPT15]
MDAQLQTPGFIPEGNLTSKIAHPKSNDILVAAELSSSSLPVPQAHPLPSTLVQWQDTTGAGDYFSDVKLTPVGYLVWFRFPVKVYVARPLDQAEASPSIQRFENWVEAVLQAVQEWGVYLPLEVIAQPEGADISILRSRPPLQASLNRETGQFNLPRARSAETTYEFYLCAAMDTNPEADTGELQGTASRQIPQLNATQSEPVLSQRFTIQLSPDQTVEYTLATARHELGHALGIWGHSPSETDTMYFSQVRNPPQISVRDINTLKRIYEQPTRLGWSLVSQPSREE